MAMHDGRFHDMIASYSRNSWLRDALRKMNIHLHLLRLYYQGAMGTYALYEHSVISAAIAAGNATAAEQAMRDHINSSRTRLSQAFD